MIGSFVSPAINKRAEKLFGPLMVASIAITVTVAPGQHRAGGIHHRDLERARLWHLRARWCGDTNP